VLDVHERLPSVTIPGAKKLCQRQMDATEEEIAIVDGRG
jgi:hypothetical protein